MQSQKLITSISTIPNESKLYFPKTNLSYSSADLKLAFNTTMPLKFPKKYIRKQTNMNMLSESKYLLSYPVKTQRSPASGISIMPTGAGFSRKPILPGD